MKLKINVDKIIIISTILVIFLGDWRIGGYGGSENVQFALSSFSDILIIITLPFLISRVKKLKLKGVTLIAFIFLLIIVNFLMHFITTNQVNFISYAISAVKIFIYLIYCLFFYNFINSSHHNYLLINLLVKIAVIFSIIGLIVYVVTLFDIPVNLEVIWSFLRQDDSSFYFGSTDIIRLRGLTNEPASFGIINCMVICIAYFNNYSYKLEDYQNIILIFTTILTFSFSTLPILLLLIILNSIKKTNYKKIFNIKSYFITFLGAGILFLFRDLIYSTIIRRFSNILQGNDQSAESRLIGSWDMINVDTLLLGHGLGNSPVTLYNNYAYILTELGIFSFLFTVIFNVYLFSRNIVYGGYFFVFMFQKGGYISAPFWITVIFLLTTSRGTDS